MPHFGRILGPWIALIVCVVLVSNKSDLKLLLVILMAVIAGVGCSNSIKDKSLGEQLDGVFERSNGNGGHYGGKIENGTYARQIPDSQCGANKVGEIIVTDQAVISKDLDVNSCQTTETIVDRANLDYALYSKGRVGLTDGLYVKQEVLASEGSEEVWCRGEGSGQYTGLDIIIKADYQNRSFEAHVVSQSEDANGQLVKTTHAPVRVSRDLSMFAKARYEGSGDFELDIRTDSRAQWAGTIQADLDFKGQGHKVYCRLGGELDAKSSRNPL